MSQPSLSREENLFDFFHNAVGDAVSSTGTVVSEDGVYYLSNLLVERGRAPEVPQPSTLVELRIQAQERGGAAAVQSWRELGDRALYTSGFFRPSLNRQNVSLDYYLSMGAAAYDQLASVMRWTGAGGGFENIYEELAHQFEACSTVLQRVRDQVRAHSHADILKLYEQWVANPDRATAEQLSELGVTPMRPGEDS
jgi:hypothetical protein